MLATTFDAIIGLKKTRQAEIDHRCNFELFFEKSREEGSEAIESKNFRLVNSNPDNPDEGIVWVSATADDVFGERLVNALESLQYKNQAELAKGMGTNQSTISRHLTRLANHRDASKRITKQQVDRWFKAARNLG